MTPSWYDVLGVDADADASRIREAFKSGIADLDPTDRRFRLLSRAAEVLLDPQRRAAHDAELAAQPDNEDDDEAWVDTTTDDVAAGGVQPESDVDADPATRAKAGKTAGAAKEPRPDRPDGRGPLVTTIVLGALALALVAATVVSLARAGDDTGSELPDAGQVAAARAAAEAAIVPVTSYDYRHLDQDKQAASSFLTPGFADELGQIFYGVIEDNAPSTKTVVQTKLLSSAVSRVGEGRVDVVLFFDQSTTNKQVTADDPEVYQNQATAEMVEQDGDWLLDCLVTTPGGGCDH